jgi:ElaA protein
MIEGVARCSTAVARAGHTHQRAGAPGAFLRRLGFEPVGEPYLEDNIPHLEMLMP